jgi:hypothetical protein
MTAEALELMQNEAFRTVRANASKVSASEAVSGVYRSLDRSVPGWESEFVRRVRERTGEVYTEAQARLYHAEVGELDIIDLRTGFPPYKKPPTTGPDQGLLFTDLIGGGAVNESEVMKAIRALPENATIEQIRAAAKRGKESADRIIGARRDGISQAVPGIRHSADDGMAAVRMAIPAEHLDRVLNSPVEPGQFREIFIRPPVGDADVFALSDLGSAVETEIRDQLYRNGVGFDRQRRLHLLIEIDPARARPGSLDGITVWAASRDSDLVRQVHALDLEGIRTR